MTFHWMNQFPLSKICQNIYFLWPVFSCIWTGFTILYLYGKIQDKENPLSSYFTHCFTLRITLWQWSSFSQNRSNESSEFPLHSPRTCSLQSIGWNMKYFFSVFFYSLNNTKVLAGRYYRVLTYMHNSVVRLIRYLTYLRLDFQRLYSALLIELNTLFNSVFKIKNMSYTFDRN